MHGICGGEEVGGWERAVRSSLRILYVNFFEVYYFVIFLFINQLVDSENCPLVLSIAQELIVDVLVQALVLYLKFIYDK